LSESKIESGNDEVTTKGTTWTTTTTKAAVPVTGNVDVDDDVLIIPIVKTIIDGATMTYIEVTLTESNVTEQRRKNSKKTMLKAINGIQIGNICLKDLQCFANRMNIRGNRKLNKYDTCKKILDAKETYDKNGLTDGILPASTLAKRKLENKPAFVINKFRSFNVIFHTDNISLLDERADTLTKEKLDIGTKTGQDYFTTIASEYSRIDVDDYDKNKYPDEVTCDPSDFVPIKPCEWLIVKKWYGILVSQYETVKSSHNVAGTHIEMVDNIKTIIEDKSMAEFGCNGRILYTHLLLEQQPGILKQQLLF
jgi:hypothetical protein